MFIKATVTQMNFILKQKESLAVFYVLLIQVIANFIFNVVTFQGLDVIQMYQPMKLLLLSYNRVNHNADATLLFIQLYPILVVFPAGFALCKEQQSGQDELMIARLGQLIYKFSKLAAAFAASMIVFITPFFIELLLNCISFPLASTGDLTNMDVYNPRYVLGVRNYLMSEIYLYSPYLYAFIGILFFGVVSGILSSFTVAFSSIVHVKYRIILFLPVFILLYASIYIHSILPDIAFTIKWYDYLLLFNEETKSNQFLMIGLLTLILFSVISILYSSRKEKIR